MPAALLCLSLGLSGCTNGRNLGVLAAQQTGAVEVPERYARCFEEVTKLPSPKGGWTQKQVFTIIAQLQDSEAAKSRCGQDLIQWAKGIEGARR
jgi:hypothetical protein